MNRSCINPDCPGEIQEDVSYCCNENGWELKVVTSECSECDYVHEWKSPADLYVNVYEVGRCYGGQEEGGWWYDAGNPIESIKVPNRKVAERLRRRLEEGRYSNRDRRPLSSVLSDYVYHVNIEHDFARPFPQFRPRYE